MKELPKVFVSPIEKKLNNNKDTFYSPLGDRKSTKDILREIDNIFHSKNFVYKSRAKITTKSGVLEETIVGKTGTSLLTMEGKAIPISDITDIEKMWQNKTKLVKLFSCKKSELESKINPQGKGGFFLWISNY